MTGPIERKLDAKERLFEAALDLADVDSDRSADHAFQVKLRSLIRAAEDFAKSERAARISKGIKTAKERGRYPGPKPLLNQLTAARMLREHGGSLEEVAEVFDCDVSTIRRALLREPRPKPPRGGK